MTAREKRHWLEFVQRAASLPLGYTVSDLKLFETTAQQQFPVLAPLIAACIDLLLAEEKGIDLPVKAAKPRSSKASPKNNDPLVDLFTDVTAFPKNLDLIRFAREKLPDIRELRFDKMGRAAIAKSIAASLRRNRPDIVENLIAEIGAFSSANRSTSSDSKRDPSFFSKWERVIRSL